MICQIVWFLRSYDKREEGKSHDFSDHTITEVGKSYDFLDHTKTGGRKIVWFLRSYENRKKENHMIS